MYNSVVLDHFQNPRNLRELKNPTVTGMGANPICGDVMTLFLEIKDGKIVTSSFKTLGCGAAIASGSILTEMLKGKTIEEARAITAQSLVTALGGLPEIKMHCPELALEALKNTLNGMESKN